MEAGRRREGRSVGCGGDGRGDLSVDPDLLDGDPYALCTPAGVVDLHTGLLRKADPKIPHGSRVVLRALHRTHRTARAPAHRVQRTQAGRQVRRGPGTVADGSDKFKARRRPSRTCASNRACSARRTSPGAARGRARTTPASPCWTRTQESTVSTSSRAGLPPQACRGDYAVITHEPSEPSGPSGPSEPAAAVVTLASRGRRNPRAARAPLPASPSGSRSSDRRSTRPPPPGLLPAAP